LQSDGCSGSEVTRQTLAGACGKRSYYERIVRNEGELNRIREYTAYNPYRWHLDYENPHREPNPKHDLDWAWLEDHTAGAT
jgi:hypothetical protein